MVFNYGSSVPFSLELKKKGSTLIVKYNLLLEVFVFLSIKKDFQVKQESLSKAVFETRTAAGS